MEFLEEYHLLFNNSFFSTLILPLRYEYIFISMIIFNVYNLYIVVSLATLASALANIVNFSIGKLIFYTLEKNHKELLEQQLLKYASFISKKTIWALLITSKIPILGALHIIILSLCKARFRNILILSILGNISYYIFKIYTI